MRRGGGGLGSIRYRKRRRYREGSMQDIGRIRQLKLMKKQLIRDVSH